MIELDRGKLVKMIDHTELRANSGAKKINRLCSEARRYGFFAVCVNPLYVPLCRQELAGSGVLVCSVIGFPLGASTSLGKAAEAREAAAAGAAEIDMVIQIGALCEGKYDQVQDDIRRVVEACQPALVKVILETCFLNDEEIVRGCELAVSAGAKFVKTSTGFGRFGARPEHVRLIRKTVGPDIGVKASGGIKSLNDAWSMIEAGASRLGISASVAIVKELSRSNIPPAS